jgi:hypothetical protein
MEVGKRGQIKLKRAGNVKLTPERVNNSAGGHVFLTVANPHTPGIGWLIEKLITGMDFVFSLGAQLRAGPDAFNIQPFINLGPRGTEVRAGVMA